MAGPDGHRRDVPYNVPMPTTFPTEFASTLDLARLPWFTVEGGNRLVLTDDARAEVGPVIDAHTHLAMSFVLPLKVDVHAETPTTQTYLPVTLPVDLERYSNKNFDKASMFAMKADLSVLAFTAQGMRTTHTAPNLVRDSAALGIERCVVLPMDLPFGARNADVLLDAAPRYPQLVPFGSVHPFDRRVDDRLAAQKARGAHGMKMHPNAQFISPDHPKTVHLCGRCGAHDLPVLIHCGPVGIEPKAAERRSQVARYEAMLAENPDTTVILGHCGALQVNEALPYAAKYPNAVFELSCLGLSDLRKVLDTVPPDRLLYGTDWPFYHQALTLARVLIATDDDHALRRRILHDNAAELFGIATDAD